MLATQRDGGVRVTANRLMQMDTARDLDAYFLGRIIFVVDAWLRG
jgi:hypothetical protein